MTTPKYGDPNFVNPGMVRQPSVTRVLWRSSLSPYAAEPVERLTGDLRGQLASFIHRERRRYPTSRHGQLGYAVCRSRFFSPWHVEERAAIAAAAHMEAIYEAEELEEGRCAI